MRAGCTRDEVADPARGMATKTAAFGLPVGGAKGGVDFDPKDPRAFGVLTRFFEQMRPWLDGHWVTAEDPGVTQQLIDEAFEEIGLSQSFHAAITRSPDPSATLERVHAGLGVMTDGLPLGDIIGGYGVAQACLGVAEGFGWPVTETEVTIRGIGTMGGGAARYLREAGAKVTAVADARGTLFDPAGLDVHALLELRDVYGEIDRSQVPAGVQQLDRDAILGITADIFVPAAVSCTIREDNVEGVAARVVVEAANAASTWAAEDALVAGGVAVVPDFIANTGAAARASVAAAGAGGDRPGGLLPQVVDRDALQGRGARRALAHRADPHAADRLQPRVDQPAAARGRADRHPLTRPFRISLRSCVLGAHLLKVVRLRCASP
uniref:Glutamate dehydrogenase n=1 Tax=Janibacter limosus TaxID=53458 RepID=A0AC61U3N6_9MICO|nr:Glu/Leu/Phe/Val dehydrogenase dimerization domain-containing protein [Janibacter limosus]